MSEGTRAAGQGAVLALLALGSLSPRPCSAQTAAGAVAIEWQAPPGCPSYADVESWLQAVLPPEIQQKLDKARAAVTIEALPNGSFRATVRVTAGDAERERSVEGPACEELARSAVVIVSVALTEAVSEQPAAHEAPPPPEPQPERAPARAPAPAPRTAPPPAPRHSPEPVVVALAAGLGAGFGEPSLRVDAAARWPLAESAALGGRARVVPAASVDTSAGAVDLVLLSGAPEACLLTRATDSLHVGACVRAELGLLRAAGSGAGALDDAALWAAVGGLPFVEWGGAVRIIAAGDVDLRLLRPTLELDDGRRLEQLPRFAYAGLLGLAAAIP